MCGIAGIYNFASGIPADSALIAKMCSALAHRGPDDEGVYCSGAVGLGHRRLSIIDLAGGHQPMSNEDGTVWIVFNGEIYNFHDLKEGLARKGHKFRTHSDTETIIHLYEEEGVSCVHALRGMFAFAIWDAGKKTLFMARDRIGKKPLHYRVSDGRITFASEIKALLADPAATREISFEALHDYLSFLYVPGPRTIFKGIRKLPAGHYLVCDSNGAAITQYWDIEFPETVTVGEDALQAELYAQLREATRLRLISDVPLGAFLSGGIDSSAVVGLMSGLQESPVITNSIGFSVKAFDELRYAALVAGRYGTDHHEYVVEPKALEALDTLERVYDEPFGDASCIPTYYVSKMARQNVTVALSGDGGDENFAGYNRYLFCAAVAALQKIAHPFRHRPLFDLYFRVISVYQEEEKARLYSGAMKERMKGYDSRDHFRKIFDACASNDHISKLQYLDMKTYLCDDVLVKVDRASMAVSLEVRSPLLDHEFMEFAARIPSGLKIRGLRGKYIFRKAMANSVPREILARPKMGFGVPVRQWLKTDLRQSVEAELFARGGIIGELFDRAYVKRLWSAVLRSGAQGFRKTDFSYRIWVLYMFSRWFRTYMQGRPR